jgi:carbamoyltransferase
MKQTRLHIWTPPIPSDTGAPPGAAYHFALANGAPWGERLRHAFYCGLPPTRQAIQASINADPDIGWLALGDRTDLESRSQIADLMAYITAQDGVIGLYQGVAETGPRALGHRSILANPCNPHTREILNNLVKHREAIRPLAPMATFEAAQRWFYLSPGAADDHYNAYNYMVLTAPARPESYEVIPAVIHRDGTGRIQIVREETDPLTHAYLKALGRRIGVEIAVNTSLNVGGPIVQSPTQALQALKRSKGMDGIIMLGQEGAAFLVWHNVLAPPKDAGQRLSRWLQAWQTEVGTRERMILKENTLHTIESAGRNGRSNVRT